MKMTVYILGAGASCCTDACRIPSNQPPLMRDFFRVVVGRGSGRQFSQDAVNVNCVLGPLRVSVEGLARGEPPGANLESVLSLVELAWRLLREQPDNRARVGQPSKGLRKDCEQMASQPLFGDDPAGVVRRVADAAARRASRRKYNGVQAGRWEILGLAYADIGWAMRRLLEWIELIYAPEEPYVHHQANPCSNYGAFVGHLAPGDTVVTFNYDFLLDEVLEQMGSLRCREGEPLPTVFDIGGGEGQYLKLHGSVLWWVEYTPQEMRQRYHTPEPLGTVHSHRFTDQLPLVRVRAGWVPHSQDCETLIVPPVVAKTFRPQIEGLWERARGALRSAKEVYVIGYSFPCTDRLVKELTRSRGGSYHGVSVKIVTKEGDPNERAQLVQRVGNAFPGAKVAIESSDGFDQWVKA
jgi:hypothetical protein